MNVNDFVRRAHAGRAPDALIEAGGRPRDVEVNDDGSRLKIDALAEKIGRDDE